MIAIIAVAGLGKVAFAEGDTASKKTIILGTSADFPPYEFHKIIQGKDEIVGFDVQIAKQIAADMNANLVIKDISFDSLLPALDSGRVDFIISGMNPTPERKKSIDFSDIYYDGKQSIMVRAEDKNKYKTMDTLKGAKIGVQKSSLQEEIGQTIEGANLTSLDKISDILIQLQTKRIDAAIMEEPVAKASLTDNTAIAKAVPVTDINGYAVGVKKGNPELLDQINKTVARLTKENKVQEYVDEASSLVNGQQKKLDTFSFFWKYKTYYAAGIKYTLLLSVLGVIFGFVIGLFIALLRMNRIAVLRWVGMAYIEVLRGTPMLLQLFIIHYGLAISLGINFTALESGIITLSINSSAYLAEIFRAGIQGVDRGQMEAARSLGMTHTQSFKTIILPQAIKSVLPAIGNEFITIIKESSIVSFIGVADLMFQTQVVRGLTFAALNPLIIAGIIYFILTFGLSKLLGLLERKLRTSDIH
ncbi:polar amino acid transport system substrate-binding protein [Paenibacillus shirakamiensis]|uniref:Polar amino acid transport system substrate-binding protein n=1 Tax=Paenibacillus shirakamiensis TaxID=1265935 RepID=A0ABS4JDP8_9BACL|nr:ABC transporter substrate-binding protein/permease [Paenibacillus shirakamiensis]MBP1999836.1 polar amino acid transport system substrate-binding protein [Paenibacillus shirakamiensis]